MARLAQPAVTTVLANNMRLLDIRGMVGSVGLVSIAGVGIGQAGCDKGVLEGIVALGCIGLVGCLASDSVVTAGGSSVGWSVEAKGAL